MKIINIDFEKKELSNMFDVWFYEYSKNQEINIRFNIYKPNFETLKLEIKTFDFWVSKKEHLDQYIKVLELKRTYKYRKMSEKKVQELIKIYEQI